MNNSTYDLVFWGLGYIGFSNLIHFSALGMKCIGIDVDPCVRKQISAGTYKSDLTGWTKEEGIAFFRENPVKLFSNGAELAGYSNKIHFVCVPTEVNGEPDSSIISGVIDDILSTSSADEDINVLIESTMSPGTAEKLYRKLLLGCHSRRCRFGVSPRRDWFTKEIPGSEIVRVIGADNGENLEFFKELLSPVYPKLVAASDYRHAEMCKSVENAIRHVSITLANQLADAFPDMDIREVLELASTKWNIGAYWPSFGPGGYCIPVSSKYLVDSVGKDSLPLLRETVRYTHARPIKIGEDICRLIPGPNVLILGLTYEANIAVDKGAAILDILRVLKTHGCNVFLNDPFFSDEKLRMHYGGIPFRLAGSDEYWEELDAVVLNVFDHRYESLDPVELTRRLHRDAVVFDNTGRWSQLNSLPEMSGRYHLIGTPSWFSQREGSGHVC